MTPEASRRRDKPTSEPGVWDYGEAPLGRARVPRGRTGWLRAELFRETDRGPIGWRKVLLAAIAVIAGAAISLTRTSGPGALNTIWIEDARDLLNASYLAGPFWHFFSVPLNGYFESTAKLVTGAARWFPITWQPGVMTIAAALQYALAGLIVYIASGPYLRNRWLRLLIAAPCVMLPLGYTQSNNDLATIQFVTLYGIFWLLLWIPGTRWGQVIAPIAMLSVSSSSLLPVFFAPLLAARLIASRTKTSWAIAACWLLGFIVNLYPSFSSKNNRIHAQHNNPVWTAKFYVTRVVPRALFGEKALGGPGTDGSGRTVPLHITSMAGHLALIAGAWAILLVAAIIAVARFTDPHWPLAVTAGLFSFVMFEGELFINPHVMQPRYAMIPAQLLYTAIVAALRPSGATGTRKLAATPEAAGGRRLALRAPWASRLPLAGFAVLLAVAITLNFRVVNNRSNSPPWTSVVATARASCADNGKGLPSVNWIHYARLGNAYRYWHYWWHVDFPCTMLDEPGASHKGG